ncbi:Argininosuccinate lyase [Phytophthora nicotianae]|nr:Argininosuccinate lyase [Phytophthora nicotianae]
MAPLDAVEQPYGKEPRPLVQKKGAVFCRDHTKDKLIHVATTNELPAFLIEIELLKEKADVIPNGNLPLHEGKGIELLKNEPECRVYRFTLQVNGSDKLATSEIMGHLPTEAVLLALEDCKVEISGILNDKHEEGIHHISMKIGGDVHLKTGNFSVKLLSSSAKKTPFVLAEVF